MKPATAAAHFTVKHVAADGHLTAANSLNVPGTCCGHNSGSSCSTVECHKDASPVRLVVDFSAKESAQDLLESSAKFSREHGVDERVNGGVAVPEPEDDGEDERGNALFTEGSHKVHGEEGEPAENETADDDAQSLGSLRFHSESSNLILDVPAAESFVVLLLGSSCTAACRHSQVCRVIDNAADHGCYAAHVPELVGRARQRHVEQGWCFKIDPG